VFWIDASSQTSITAGLLKIVPSCGQFEDCGAIISWFSNLQMPWLLVFDNADDPTLDLSAFFPASSRGIIIITSRNPECAEHATIGRQKVEGMDADEACDLLVKIVELQRPTSEDIRQHAHAVVQCLGYLALPIVHAGAYLKKGLCKLEDFPSKLATQRQILLNYRNQQGSTEYRYTTYATLELSVKHIESLIAITPATASGTRIAAADALELLQFIPFLHFEKISEVIIERAWANSLRQFRYTSDIPQEGQLIRLAQPTFPQDENPFSEPASWNSDAIRQAFAFLASYSLVSINSYKEVSIHPIIHMWTKDRISDAFRQAALRTALGTLSASISWESDSDDYEYRRYLIPHIDACLKDNKDDIFQLIEDSIEVEEELNKIAYTYSENWEIPKAEELETKILSVRKKKLGEEHRDTLTSMSNLASSYCRLGRNEEAAQLEERCWKLRKKKLGVDHPETLVSMHGLAGYYSRLGRSEEAAELEERCLELRKKELGEEHLDTLKSISCLAIYYNELGRSEEAAELEERCWELRKKKLGEEHLETLLWVCCLAGYYARLGRSKEAAELDGRCWELTKKKLGEDHPDTLRSMSCLAADYHRLGRNEEAVKLEERCWELTKKKLGVDHPDTLISMDNLASYYDQLGRSGEAAELEERCWVLRKKKLGVDHPATLTSMDNLAHCYDKLGRSEEAAELDEQCWELRKKKPGVDHPDTLASMSNLAVDYHRLSRNEEAAKLEQRCWELRKKKLGEEHIDTIISMNNLAWYYDQLGRSEEAVELGKQCVELRKKKPGGEYPDTVALMDDLASYYSHLGRSEEVAELRARCVELRKKKLGGEHPDTLISTDTLAEHGNESSPRGKSGRLSRARKRSLILDEGENGRTTRYNSLKKLRTRI
jgi:tetratricopeptide (TPR) repeat protein